jgi:nucleoside-diphosphate-sugar epimerase
VRVLVIGGTRLSGPYLVRELLDRGHDAAVFHRGRTEADLPPQVTHFHGDLADGDALRSAARRFRPTGLVHLWAMKPADVDVMIDTFAGQLDRFILISSGDVYSAFEDIENRRPSAQPIPIPEDAPLRTGPYLPPHPADYDKLGAERSALAAAEAGTLPAVVLRYPAVYGPGALREWYWVKRILDGRPRIALPDAGLSVMHRGFAGNVAHAVALALESARPGTVYNVGDEATYTARRITHLIAEIMGHSWEAISVPASAWPHGTPYSTPNHLLYDISRIRADLGYRDLVPPEEALRLTVEHLAANPPDTMLPHLSPQAFDYAAEDDAIERFRR